MSAPPSTRAPRRSRLSLLDGDSVDRPALAAALMVFALMLLGLQDAIVKLTSSAVSLWQFQLVRSAINLALVLALARVLWGEARPRAKRWWAVILRSLFLVATMVMFFGGVPFLSLAEIAAGLYTYPLYIAIFSAVLLREKVGPRRIAAILAGFIGTVMILKPGGVDFSPVSLMPVGAALGYAGTVLTTRNLCREESPVALAFGVAITFLTVGIIGTALLSLPAVIQLLGSWPTDWPYLATGWRPLTLVVFALIVACSLLNLTANISLAKSYQSAESSWLAPFDYSYLIFATFWGFVFSGTIPDQWTFAGMALIAGAGIFVAWRERAARRQTARGALTTGVGPRK
ncbi:MAG: DMT family transporter [Pseudomonadota bacterium]